MQLYNRFVKRGIDILGALVMLILTLPVLIILCLVLLIDNRGSVFFVQIRAGKQGKLFHIIKLKTMRDTRDENGKLLPEELRITTVGKFVRRCSIDEIPQIINVLAGDMSLIGPRPLLPDYLPLYNDFQKRRHEVKPGITGWAQVNGRNAVSWDERFKHDIWYVDHLCFSIDCKIFYKTISKVLKNEDGAPEDAVVMKRFTGNF